MRTKLFFLIFIFLVSIYSYLNLVINDFRILRISNNTESLTKVLNDIEEKDETFQFSSFVTVTNPFGRLGNVLCIYSSIMFYQLKYGLKGVYHEHQLKKLEKYFKPELFQISPIKLNEEPFSSIK